MAVNLQKYIAEAGLASRRKAEEFITQGIVRVNGEPARLGMTVSEGDVVTVNGREIKPEKKIYLMLNKPQGYITTLDDPWGRLNVRGLIHLPHRLFPVGRLDKDTTGLLLMTNDGEWANRIMHPRYEVRKVYEAVLDRKFEDEDMRKLSEGIILDGKRIEARAQRLSNKRVRIVIHTGLNKEIKRLFKSLGYWVRDLERIEIGGVPLNVKEGKFRHLSDGEVERLRSSAASPGRKPVSRRQAAGARPQARGASRKSAAPPRRGSQAARRTSK